MLDVGDFPRNRTQCREAPAEHVDHDHATERVRGLLCVNCNGALGQFRDRPDLMLRAVMYLRGGPQQVTDFLPFELSMSIGGYDSGRPPGEPWPVFDGELPGDEAAA